MRTINIHFRKEYLVPIISEEVVNDQVTCGIGTFTLGLCVGSSKTVDPVTFWSTGTSGIY